MFSRRSQAIRGLRCGVNIGGSMQTWFCLRCSQGWLFNRFHAAAGSKRLWIRSLVRESSCALPRPSGASYSVSAASSGCLAADRIAIWACRLTDRDDRYRPDRHMTVKHTVMTTYSHIQEETTSPSSDVWKSKNEVLKRVLQQSVAGHSCDRGEVPL